jgi:hypothetical protein
VATSQAPARIAPKSIFADETIIEFILRKYAESGPRSQNGWVSHL